MVRQTSIDTYHQIKKEGLLSKRRQEVLDLIVESGTLTIAETIQKFKKSNNLVNTSTISARFSELQEREVIEEAKTDKCPITGRQAIFWVFTGKLPKKIDQQSEAKIKNQIMYHERKLKRLRDRLQRMHAKPDNRQLKLYSF